METAYWTRLAMIGALLAVVLLMPGRNGVKGRIGQSPIWLRSGIAAFLIFTLIAIPDRVIGRTLQTTYPDAVWVAPFLLWLILVLAMVIQSRRRS